ncbi:MAG TPA: hypothetical protein VG897_18370, partial [Terriglobales bacterium]|nr:hypothetical protein [Terriglobales bacterium]
YELAILVETQRHLDWLYHNRSEAQKLVVPDGSRRIFDTADRLSGLLTLSSEIDDLLKEVAREQGNLSFEPSLQMAREILANGYVPAA